MSDLKLDIFHGENGRVILKFFFPKISNEKINDFYLSIYNEYKKGAMALSKNAQGTLTVMVKIKEETAGDYISCTRTTAISQRGEIRESFLERDVFNKKTGFLVKPRKNMIKQRIIPRRKG